MGMLDKVKYLLGIDEVEEDEEEVMEEASIPARPASPAKIPAPNGYASNAGAPKDARVIDLKPKADMKLVVNEPKNFDECSKIVDNLKDKKPVILNLEKLETDIAKRIFDFVSGATYALDGSVQKVAKDIFIFAPSNVNIASNIEEFKTLNKKNLFDE